MKISIVTPSFNQGRFLPDTAQSILGQQGDFELRWIVMDGGSTDGTVEFLRSIDDPRLTWISEKDRGQCHAINKGMAMAANASADGDVLAWLNSDDLYEPGALATVAQSFAAHPAAQWAIGRCRIIDEDGREIRRAVTRYKDRILRRYTYRRLLRQNLISQPAAFWRRGLWQECGGVDESLHWCMDYDLWLRFGRRGDPLMIDSLLSSFRMHGQSKSGQVSRRQFDEQYAVARRYLGADHVSALLHRVHVEKIVWAYRGMRLLGM